MMLFPYGAQALHATSFSPTMATRLTPFPCRLRQSTNGVYHAQCHEPLKDFTRNFLKARKIAETSKPRLERLGDALRVARAGQTCVD